MKNLMKNAKKVIAGAGLVAMFATTNIAAKGAYKASNDDKKPTKKTEWELQEEENKALCSKLPNYRYIAPKTDVMMQNGSNPDTIVELHGTCYATFDNPVWSEQLESEIEYAIEAPAGIMSLVRNSDGTLKVQAFANNNCEMIITFKDAKSCLLSCPANKRASISPDAEISCECEDIENEQSEKPVSSLKKAKGKNIAMIQSMLNVQAR